MIVGPLQFDSPAWLVLIPIGGALAWLIARRSLSGLGRTTRWMALGLRVVVLTIIAVALAEPRTRLKSDDLAVILVNDESRSMPPGTRDALLDYLEGAFGDVRPGDRLGLVTVAEQGKAQEIPGEYAHPTDVLAQMKRDGAYLTGGQNGTNIAEGVSLALGMIPQDTAARLLIVSDGNETAGSLLQAAEQARAMGVPLDVLLIKYERKREILFDRLIAPATGRKGQNVNVRFLITTTKAARVSLSLLVDGEPYDLDPESPATSVVVDLEPGQNVHTATVKLTHGGAQRFKAVVEPIDPASDAVSQNNTAQTVTFVSTEGKVLLYTSNDIEAQNLLRALSQSRIDVDIRDSRNEGHSSLDALQEFDAVILANVPASDFTGRQQQELATYVRDLGGGLVMVGGPYSFGAGGWIGSPVAEVLPLKMNPPEKRQVPRGALALIMHSCEMPQGNFWGKQTALAAINALNRLDLIGIIEYSGFGGAMWLHPMQVKGDGMAVSRAINNLTFGDMPDFGTAMQKALTGLVNAKAGQKHCIIISDGDPSPPSQSLIQKFINNKISISTVAVFPHGGGANSPDLVKMSDLPKITGGNYYSVVNQGDLTTLPQIFVKEVERIQRGLIQETEPFQPTLSRGVAEPLHGIRALPAISGYIITADRGGVSQVTARGPEEDPILAQWQHGLGRSVAFTSDAASRWCAAWMSWGQYKAFWEQHLRWVMRPSGSANIDIVTVAQGDTTDLIVTALDSAGNPLNFAHFAGRVAGPTRTGVTVSLSQTAPGRYEGSFPSGDPGSYQISLRYKAPKRDGSGTEEGVAQAAVSRPFADEHRATKDNAGLLIQASERTGGRVLSDDPASADVFSREHTTQPTATRPIWLAVALAGMGLFLVDVAVRRVRIDIPAMTRAVGAWFGRSKEASVARVDSLREARAQAQERMRAQGGSGAVMPTPDAPTNAPSAARTKFEADPASVTAASHDPTRRSEPTDLPRASTSQKQESSPTDGSDESGMSRLMRAKRRARDTMADEADEKPTEQGD